MGLTEDIMAGRELQSPDLIESQPLDLVIEGRGRILVAYAGWWTEEWSHGAGVMTFEGVLSSGQQGEAAPHLAPVWSFVEYPDTRITGPSDEDMQGRLEQMRRRTDLYRGEYLYQFDLLRDAYAEDDFDFEAWQGAILARPRVDATTEERRRNTGARKIGRLFLRDQDNEIVDILVVDEHGNAATARDNAALAHFEEDWLGRDTRPEIEDYLAWAVTQQPYGPYEFEGPVFEQGTGTVEQIAGRLLS
jgi:hypothetical protein